jgi:GMP synthase (glutamine-hydrolysing)
LCFLQVQRILFRNMRFINGKNPRYAQQAYDKRGMPMAMQAKLQKTALVFQHVGFENLDGFAPAFTDCGVRVSYAPAWDVVQMADTAKNVDILVVMGGPIGVPDAAAYPFMPVMVDVVRERLQDTTCVRPTLGVCLGSQIMAAALGARVYPSGVFEVGFKNVQLTTAGQQSPLAPLQHTPETFHWHGDTFDLPETAELLASTVDVPHQAFRLHAARGIAGAHNALALQFHPEFSGTTIEPWLVGHAHEIAHHALDVPALRMAAHAKAAQMQRTAYAIAQGWLQSLVFPDERS